MRPDEEWLLASDNSDNIVGHVRKEANCAYAFQALQKRRDADRHARIHRIMAVIGPIILSGVVVALWLWLGQR